MAKRGRPAVGKTVGVRVPESLYLLVTWIADAQRKSSVRALEAMLWPVATQTYLGLLDTIKKLKEIEDLQASLEGRAPIPLPSDVLVPVLRDGKEVMVPAHEVDTTTTPFRKSAGKFLVSYQERGYEPGLFDDFTDEEMAVHERNPPTYTPPPPATDPPQQPVKKKPKK